MSIVNSRRLWHPALDATKIHVEAKILDIAREEFRADVERCRQRIAGHAFVDEPVDIGPAVPPDPRPLQLSMPESVRFCSGARVNSSTTSS